MRFNIKIPQIIEANDYHEFSFIEDFLHSVGLTKIKVEEIDSDNGYYYGILYTNKNDPKFKKLKKELVKELQTEEK